jgi:hypothetical protein
MHTEFLTVKLEGRFHFGDICVNESMILNWLSGINVGWERVVLDSTGSRQSPVLVLVNTVINKLVP